MRHRGAYAVATECDPVRKGPRGPPRTPQISGEKTLGVRIGAAYEGHGDPGPAHPSSRFDGDSGGSHSRRGEAVASTHVDQQAMRKKPVEGRDDAPRAIHCLAFDRE